MQRMTMLQNEDPRVHRIGKIAGCIISVFDYARGISPTIVLSHSGGRITMSTEEAPALAILIMQAHEYATRPRRERCDDNP